MPGSLQSVVACDCVREMIAEFAFQDRAKFFPQECRKCYVLNAVLNAVLFLAGLVWQQAEQAATALSALPTAYLADVKTLVSDHLSYECFLRPLCQALSHPPGHLLTSV